MRRRSLLDRYREWDHNRGLSHKEIPRQLKISLPTVKNCVHNILEKLQVRRRGAAAALLREVALGRASTQRSPARQHLSEDKAREDIIARPTSRGDVARS